MAAGRSGPVTAAYPKEKSFFPKPNLPAPTNLPPNRQAAKGNGRNVPAVRRKGQPFFAAPETQSDDGVYLCTDEPFYQRTVQTNCRRQRAALRHGLYGAATHFRPQRTQTTFDTCLNKRIISRN
jgi:hypothetical protein